MAIEINAARLLLYHASHLEDKGRTSQLRLPGKAFGITPEEFYSICWITSPSGHASSATILDLSFERYLYERDAN